MLKYKMQHINVHSDFAPFREWQTVADNMTEKEANEYHRKMKNSDNGVWRVVPDEARNVDVNSIVERAKAILTSEGVVGLDRVAKVQKLQYELHLSLHDAGELIRAYNLYRI